jgi:site-specific recombinase XerD
MDTKQKSALPHLDKYILHLITHNYSKETIYNYERDLLMLENFLKNDLQIPFQKFDKQALELYKAELVSIDRKTANGVNAGTSTLSSRSINRALSAFRSYLSFLIANDISCPIPREAVTLIRMERRHARVAELEELIRLIEAPTTMEKNKEVAIRNRAILETLFATGMRISELVSLNCDQLDGKGKIFVKGKGKKERFVYMTPRATEYVNRYVSLHKEKKGALFTPLRGRNAKSQKARISTNYLQDKIKKYREALGIVVPTSAHSLRHGFATYLAESGANPAAIQILLGHESLETTTRYVHPSDKFAETTHKKFHPLQNA